MRNVVVHLFKSDARAVCGVRVPQFGVWSKGAFLANKQRCPGCERVEAARTGATVGVAR